MSIIKVDYGEVGGGGVYAKHLANVVGGDEIDAGFTPKIVIIIFHTLHRITFYKESMGNYSNIYDNWNIHQSAFPNSTDIGIRNINGSKITINSDTSTTNVDIICLAEEPT